MNIEVKQDAIYVKKDWWEWSVWIDGPDEELDQVNFVEYTLHPTFPNPIRQRNDRSTKFRLEAAGWGGFTIYLAVHLKSGEVLNLKHLFVLKFPESLEEREPPMRGVEPKQTTLYLSSSAADAYFADVLRKVLKDRGINVLTSNDFEASLPVKVSIKKVMDQADMAVAIVSDRSSYWVSREVEYLKDHGKRIIPVIVGSVSRVLPALSDIEGIHVGEVSNLQDAADEVAEQIVKVSLS